MRSELGLENAAKSIVKLLSETLDRCGIMYRIFHRIKSEKSINKKVVLKNYRNEGKKITDLIGIRLTLYFQDDVILVQNKLMNDINYDHLSKDDVKVDEFKPVRCNLTFNFSEQHIKEVKKIINGEDIIVDTKYEVQLRTVLSEGWHEVEHDLRYKCQSEWTNHSDLSRNMNGILASLETSEFSMLQLFNELAYRHYKDQNLEAMIKSQFRIRFVDTAIDPRLKDYIMNNRPLLKKIRRTPRESVLKELIESRFSLPMNIDNFLYVVNFLFIKDSGISELAGEFILDELTASFSV